MRLGAVPAVIFLGVSVSRSRPPRAGGAFRASLPRPAPPGSGPASRSIGSGSHQEDGSMPGLDQEADGHGPQGTARAAWAAVTQPLRDATALAE